jgi:hypothetical protein
MDGIALVLLDPQGDVTAQEAVVNQFSFETDPYSGTFEMHELANLDTLITVDDEGNAIHFTSFKREPGGCQEGFMRGEWIRKGRDWGEFRGGWISLDGELTGHIRGIWGRALDGNNVLYGKYISADGAFEGLLKGTFGAHPTFAVTGALGWFKGRWYDEDGNAQGVFGGRWKEPTTRGRGGYFRGMWGQQCPELEEAVAYSE